MINPKNKLIIILIFSIILLSNTLTTYSKEVTISELKNKYEKILSKASLEIIDNVTILHVNGSYYEMGYQHGYLLKDKINQNYRAIMNFAEQKGVTVDELENIWDGDRREKKIKGWTSLNLMNYGS